MKFQITLDIKRARAAKKDIRLKVEKFLQEKVANLTVKIVKDKIVAIFTMVTDQSLFLVGCLKDHLGFPHLPAVSKLST
jgi:hypothetical protein